MRRVPAVLMRGGARQGLFFLAQDLPRSPRARDALLLRVLGGPDPAGRRIDGLVAGGGVQVAIVERSSDDRADVDLLFGALPDAGEAFDWGAQCDQLAAAVGPFALEAGLCPPGDGVARVRVRMPVNGVRFDAFVPVRGATVLETGAFVEEGLPFAAAEVRLEFLDPPDPPFPTGVPRERLTVPGLGEVAVTVVGAGEPTVFVRADAIGLTARESAADLERSRRVRERLDAIAARAASRLADAGTTVPALRVAWVARPAAYRSLSGGEVAADAIDVLVRAMCGGRLQEAASGAGSIAVAVAAATPGTVVAEVARTLPGVPVRIGHPAGLQTVGADLRRRDDAGAPGDWLLERVTLSRSARRLFSGVAHLPAQGH